MCFPRECKCPDCQSSTRVTSGVSHRGQNGKEGTLWEIICQVCKKIFHVWEQDSD